MKFVKNIFEINFLWVFVIFLNLVKRWKKETTKIFNKQNFVPLNVITNWTNCLFPIEYDLITLTLSDSIDSILIYFLSFQMMQMSPQFHSMPPFMGRIFAANSIEFFFFCHFQYPSFTLFSEIINKLITNEQNSIRLSTELIRFDWIDGLIFEQIFGTNNFWTIFGTNH